MPGALSLAVFRTKKNKTLFEWEVPWEVAGYAEDARIAAESGGFFDLSAWAILEVRGRDALDFLHRLSTVNFKKLATGDTAHGAFLTGKGTVVGLGIFHRVEDGAILYLSPSQRVTVADHLEKFHFSEQLTIADKSEEWALFFFFFYAAGKAVDPGDAYVSWRETDYVPTLFVRLPRVDANAALRRWQAAGVSLLGERLYHFSRRELGIPLVGWEVSGKEILLECNFDRSIAPNKGCYPGQEVVERIQSYGSVNRKLRRVALTPAGNLGDPPIQMLADGKTVGTVVGLDAVPGQAGEFRGLAYVHKSYWDFPDDFGTDQTGVTVRLTER